MHGGLASSLAACVHPLGWAFGSVEPFMVRPSEMPQAYLVHFLSQSLYQLFLQGSCFISENINSDFGVFWCPGCGVRVVCLFLWALSDDSRETCTLCITYLLRMLPRLSVVLSTAAWAPLHLSLAC